MKSRLLSMSLCLVILGAGAVRAEPPKAFDSKKTDRILQEGWREVQEGVLERRAGTRIETITYGESGRRWKRQNLQERIRFLEQEYRAHPSQRLARVVERLKIELSRPVLLPSPEPPEMLNATGASCSPTYAAHAVAESLTGSSAPGVTANADASFHSACGELGNAYAYAYARATEETTTTVKIQEDPRYGGTDLASTASASSDGDLDCYSEAFAHVESTALSLDYQVLQTNSTCPTPVSTDQRPFHERPFVLPGTIKGADFDEGGEGVAYHKVIPINTVHPYRDTTVNLYGDFLVRPTEGDWLEYTVDVPTPGTYALVAQVSGVDPGGSFHLEWDGVDITGALSVPVTGSTWIEWGSVLQPGVKLTAGRHVLRVAIDETFDGLHFLRFLPTQVPFLGTPIALPGTFKAVDFDEGGEQAGSHDNTVGCDGSCEYRVSDVDRYGEWIIHASAGEWLEYTVHVGTAGTYTLGVQVASETGGGTFHIEVDGVNVTGTMTAPTTGGWSVFQTVSHTGVSLPAGMHRMRLVIDSNGGHYDSMSFKDILALP